MAEVLRQAQNDNAAWHEVKEETKALVKSGDRCLVILLKTSVSKFEVNNASRSKVVDTFVVSILVSTFT